MTNYPMAVETEVGAVARLLERADVETPVPTCPGWTIRDLVVHLGGTHRWATHIVATRAAERVPYRQVVTDPSPSDDLVAWLRSGAEDLLAALRAADPDAPVWTWGEDRHQRFWPRRMLHETIVHRADLEIALGLSPRIDPEHAVDGIDEFLANLPHARSIAPRLERLTASGEVVHLHATDVEGEWLVTLPPAGYAWSRGHGKGDAALRGPVSDLLLVVYGRRSPDTLAVFGDRELLERWITTTAL
ncbi:maleylpyruvate isomerase family mycothiol-dependent enzyme [Nonomuraea sp. NPDC050663]|uniref:maleylpyruvate isomerase family mycothiol-dependent enzyme n=1 Tax=Nonomuraea sp. NPDC050663 TaxID=3364370 RepID=UPI003791CF4E